MEHLSAGLTAAIAVGWPYVDSCLQQWGVSQTTAAIAVGAVLVLVTLAFAMQLSAMITRCVFKHCWSALLLMAIQGYLVWRFLPRFSDAIRDDIDDLVGTAAAGAASTDDTTQHFAWF